MVDEPEEPSSHDSEGKESAPIPAKALAETPSPLVPSSKCPMPSQRERPRGPNPTLDLLKYLKNLAEDLPEERKTGFLTSDARVKMEFLIDKLEGRPGLLHEAEGLAPLLRPKLSGIPDAELKEKSSSRTNDENRASRKGLLAVSGRSAPPATQVQPATQVAKNPAATSFESLKRTLSYLRTLAEALPDRDLTVALDRKVEKVIQTLDRT
jgi:hypothetical protein